MAAILVAASSSLAVLSPNSRSTPFAPMNTLSYFMVISWLTVVGPSMVWAFFRYMPPNKMSTREPRPCSSWAMHRELVMTVMFFAVK